MALRSLLIFVLMFGPASAAIAESTLEATVAAANNAFVKALEAGDVTAATSRFADDAIFIRGHNTVLRGKGAIVAMLRERLSRAKFVGGMCSTRTLESVGATAWETGSCTYTTSAGGSKKTSSGRFMTLWKRGDDGQWRIEVNVAE